MMYKKTTLATIFLSFASLTLSCVPAHLQKYRRQSTLSKVDQAGTVNDSFRRDERSGQPAKAGQPDVSRPSIYAIDQQTFRFQISEANVWDSAINVILKNYNLTIVDKDSGVITTEWDTFYLQNQVFRNKLSMRVSRVNRRTTDIIIHNAVERLQDGTAAAGAVGAVWLPAEDKASEPHRIIQNMAIMLNQPPPSIPGSNVAKGFSDKSAM